MSSFRRKTDRKESSCRRAAGSFAAMVIAGFRPQTFAAGFAVAVLMAPTGAFAQASGDMVGQLHTYKTHYDDTLLDIARDARLGAIELMSANPGVDAWLPGADVTLLLPTAHLLPDAPHKGIVINTAELRLYYFGDPARPLSFPIGVGRDGYLTPVGTTKIARKKEKPSWYLTPSEVADHPELPAVIPPGDDNPLGDYALYLGWPSYLIHGTNVAWGIGRRASRGCIRMYPENIEWIFNRVPVGTPVTVVDQVVKLGRMEGDLYVEVQPSSKQIDIMEETSKAPAPPEPLPVAEWTDRILVAAGPDIERIDWNAVEKALADRQGFPVRIATSAEHAGMPAPTPVAVDQPKLAAAPLPANMTPAPSASTKAEAAPPVAAPKVVASKPATAAKSASVTPAVKPAAAKSQSSAQALKPPPTKPVKATAGASAVTTSASKSTVVQKGSTKMPSPAAKPTSGNQPAPASQRTASR